MNRRQYVNPPIQEALCELRFERGLQWGVLTAGELSAQFGDAYPAVPKSQLAGGIEVEQAQDGQSVRWRAGEERVVFSTDDETRLVVAGPASLGIHVLNPYEGWEAFSERISNGVRLYSEVLRPRGVTRVGLRYVNRVILPEPAVDLDDYFTIGPRTPPQIPLSMTGFLTRIESSFVDDAARMVQTFASAGADGEKAAVLLDLDLIREFPDGPLDLESVDGVVEHLRNLERSAFEAMITDKSREMFDV